MKGGLLDALVGWERRPDGGYGLTQGVRVAYLPGATASETITVSIGKGSVWQAE